MRNPTKNISLGKVKNLELDLYSRFLEHSAGVRDKTEAILKYRQSKYKDRKIVCIDGSEFSSKIRRISDKNIDNSPLLLPAGIDGVIMQTSKQFELIMPVADCAAIGAWNADCDTAGLFHAGYKGVAGNGEDLGMINNMFDKLSFVSEDNSLDNYNFYLSPMMGGKFELPLDYVRNLFKKIFTEFGLDEEKYFYSHDNDIEKIYLDLQGIILDLFSEFGVKKSSIKVAIGAPTNDPNSIYPSFRLYSIAKSIIKKSIESGFELDGNPERELYGIKEDNLTIQELELLLSGKIKRYLTDYRLALSLKNKTS